MEGSSHIINRHAYSDRINERRRSLFPRKTSDTIDNSDDSDLEHVTPLNVSDTEFGCPNDVGNSLFGFENTQTFIGLSTPTNKKILLSETSMSPLYLSPCTNKDTDKRIFSSISPTKCLKTPNDSNVLPGMIPKLSRKSLQDQMISEDSMEDLDSLPIHSKNSKVRTSLFPDEVSVSLAPHQFYPRINSQKPSFKPNISMKKSSKIYSQNKKRQRKSTSRRISGQINAGVRHGIKKPKQRKVYSTSIASLSKIKTFKTDDSVNDELELFLEDLAELKAQRELKLIQHVEAKNTPSSSENKTPWNLKRPLNADEDNNCKRARLEEESHFNPPSISNHLQTIGSGEDLEINSPENIGQILNFLSESLEEDKENENKQDRCPAESLLSPTSEMCNMASVMKIDSPKKMKNLNLVFQKMGDEEVAPQQTKECTSNSQLFPVFYPNHDTGIKQKRCVQQKRKRTKLSSNQMLLDAGQKSFGLTECSECNYCYHAGDPNDEILHESHHNASHILHFPGWKNEQILINYPNDGRIIQILPNSSKIWIEKANRIMEVVNRDLGYYDMVLDISNSKVFLFIKNKTVAGCLVAENKARGYKILTSDVEIDMCSTEEYPIQCGVSRIWVHHSYRRKGIATKLMDTLKVNFITGNTLNNCDIALSSPTIAGKLFGAKYFQTNNFFTYFD